MADLRLPLKLNSHSAREVCDLLDLVSLAKLLDVALASIDLDFSLNRDDYT
jgi:hypothetical protein